MGYKTKKCGCLVVSRLGNSTWEFIYGFIYNGLPWEYHGIHNNLTMINGYLVGGFKPAL